MNRLNEIERSLESPFLDHTTHRSKILRALLNMRISGESRRTKFFFKILSKGLVSGVSREDKDKILKIATQFDKVITILNNKMGDNWDFLIIPEFYGVEDTFTLSIYVVIKYPEIHITNSNGEEHDIFDLFVNFKVLANEDNIYFSNLEGTRGTLHANEINYSYYHSHLLRPYYDGEFKYGDGFKTSSFCLGESETQEMIETLSEGFDPLLFEAFLYSLDTLLSWESLEGVPYRYIDSIRDIIPDSVGEKILYPERIVNESGFLSAVNSEIPLKPRVQESLKNLDFRVQDDRIIIIPNSKVDHFIKEAIEELPEEVDIDVLYYKKPGETRSNVMYSAKNLKIPKNPVEAVIEKYLKNILDSEGNPPYFYFRGEKQELKIIHNYTFEEGEEEEDWGEEVEVFVHPNAVKIIKEHYEKILSTQTINKFL